MIVFKDHFFLTQNRIDTISTKKNTVNDYKYPLTQKNIYYRIKAVMEQGNYYTFALAYFALTMKVEPQNP